MEGWLWLPLAVLTGASVRNSKHSGELRRLVLQSRIDAGQEINDVGRHSIESQQGHSDRQAQSDTPNDGANGVARERRNGALEHFQITLVVPLFGVLHPAQTLPLLPPPI